MLFTLLTEISQCTKKNNKPLPCYTKYKLKAGCFQTNSNAKFEYGDDLLKNMYGSSDPYEISWKYCGSNTKWTNQELAVDVNNIPFVHIAQNWLSATNSSTKTCLWTGSMGFCFFNKRNR